jgi:mannose-6-phosphate isomerase-like protein (cupin superfamily)
LIERHGKSTMIRGGLDGGMNISLASDWPASFARTGYMGPVPFLTEAECVLVQNYARRGELAAPLAWAKGLAARDQLIHGIATRPELLDWLAQLLGSHVYLWGAQMIAKQPGEAHPWHTDIETSLPTGKFVSVWIGVENTSSRSALQYIAGSHLIGKPLQQVAHECGVDRPDRIALRALALAKSIRPDAALVEADVRDGDAILFDGRIWHGSLNSEERPRRALLLQYAAANQKVRIPDKTLNWPFAYTRDPPPAITVLGRARGYANLVDPPQGKRLDQALLAAIKPVPDGKRWTPHPLMKGRAASVGSLGVHYSLLQPGHSPHPPHAHVEEEILIVIEGEADVILPESEDDPAPVIQQLKPGDFTYYPAYRWHTIRNASAKPIVYLMLKWRGTPLGLTQHVPPGVFLDEGNRVSDGGKPFQIKLVFEGATHFLTKLHAHRSVLLPGGGYEPHADPYDVMIVLIEGSVRTMDRTMTAPAFFYHPAGSLHGIRNVGHGPAGYLVVEMHGKRRSEAWSMGDEFTAQPGGSWTAWRVT